MSTTAEALKTSLMAGRPCRMKSAGAYEGLPIPVCGAFKGTVQTPWQPPDAPTPSSLHDEILAFISYMTPTPTESRLRLDLQTRFTAAMAVMLPGSTVRAVGSSVTGLALPTSDIDLVLTPPSTYFSSKYHLAQIEPFLSNIGFASSTKAILNATVPLLRITDALTGLEIDLTVEENGHGVRSTAAVQGMVKRHGLALTALAVVLKQFLGMRRCGTTYTGGVNSYLLVWMLVAWLELEYPKMPKMKKPAAAAAAGEGVEMLVAGMGSLRLFDSGIDLGEMLIAFLRFYGKDFDYENNAINIVPTPSYGRKSYPYSRYPIQPYLLSIRDPANTSIDMGQKAYAIKHVQATFYEAYEKLKAAESLRKSRLRRTRDSSGTLRIMLGGNYRAFSKQREHAVEQWGLTQGE